MAGPAKVFTLMSLCVCSLLLGLSCGMRQNPLTPHDRRIIQQISSSSTNAKPNNVVARKFQTWGANAVINGVGSMIESYSAGVKAEAIRELLEFFYGENYEATLEQEWNNGHISTPGVALLYAARKKESKALRKGIIGGTRFAADIALSTTGATVGSVIPGAGTIAGGSVGHLAATLLVSPAVFTVDRLKRFAKYGYKKLAGTQGEHRAEASTALVNAAIIVANPLTPEQSNDRELAVYGLRIIMNSDKVPCIETDCTEQQMQAFLTIVAAKLQSN